VNGQKGGEEGINENIRNRKNIKVCGGEEIDKKT
jgi:hypothetical protein